MRVRLHRSIAVGTTSSASSSGQATAPPPTAAAAAHGGGSAPSASVEEWLDAQFDLGDGLQPGSFADGFGGDSCWSAELTGELLAQLKARGADGAALASLAALSVAGRPGRAASYACERYRLEPLGVGAHGADWL